MADRDRDRGPRGDAGAATSLWIDYILLPEMLEQHLVALAEGQAASPAPADLIAMFLEQALVNYKSAHGSSTSSLAKDGPSQVQGVSQGTSKMAGRTAALLCERAARVAVAAKLSLVEIESSIVSQQHQFMLLKALVKHDKISHRIHECNLHRWILRSSLQSHPLGSAASNNVFPGLRSGACLKGEDLADLFKPSGNASRCPLVCGGGGSGMEGDACVEEERPSVEFLERVLREDEEAVLQGVAEPMSLDSAVANGQCDPMITDIGLTDSVILQKEEIQHSANKFVHNREPVGSFMSKDYRCQVMLDVAEVHFMRGRIQRAHEFFTSCGVLLESLYDSEKFPAEAENQAGPCSALDSRKSECMGGLQPASPVARARLSGFIIACRMLLGTQAGPSHGKKRRQFRDGIGFHDPPLPILGTPSPAQWSVIACEQQRWYARRDMQDILSLLVTSAKDDMLPPAIASNAVLREAEFFKAEVEKAGTNGKRNIGENTERTVTMDDCSIAQRGNKRVKVLSLAEGSVQEVEHTEREEPGQGLGFEGTKEALDDPGVRVGPSEGHGVKTSKALPSLAEGTSNEVEIDGTDVNLVVSQQTTSESINYELVRSKERRNTVKQKSDMRENFREIKHFGQEVDFCVQPKGVSEEDNFLSDDANLSLAATGDIGKSVVQTVANDTLQGLLLWGYRLSLERDPLIPVSMRCQLIACNVVRRILEGEPIQIFLRVSEAFQNSKQGVDFLMGLMAAVKLKCHTIAGGSDAGIGADPTYNGQAQIQGLKRKFTEAKKVFDGQSMASLICELALYVCCVLDQEWCWESAVKNSLIRPTDIPRIAAQVPEMPILNSGIAGPVPKPTGSSPIVDCRPLEPVCQVETPGHEVVRTEDPNELDQFAILKHSSKEGQQQQQLPDFALEEVILCGLLHAESLGEIEALVLEAKRTDHATDVRANSESEIVKCMLGRMQQSSALVRPCTKEGESQVYEDLRSPLNGHIMLSKERSSWERLRNKCESADARACSAKLTTFPAHVAALLCRRAFNALDSRKQPNTAKRLYELAWLTHPKDYDSSLMLWLLEKVNPQQDSQGEINRPARLLLREENKGVSLNFGLVEYAILCLIEKELWNDLSEVCQWGASMAKNSVAVEGKSCEGSLQGFGKGQGMGTQTMHKRFTQTLKVATALADLMQLCSALQAATARNHFNEDVARMGSTMWQLFEDFMCLLVGVEVDGQSQGGDDSVHSRVNQSGQIAPPPAYPGAEAVPLIPQVSNSRVLVSLASLMAGWLHRCHAAGLTPWALAVERYGVLAGVTAAASLPPPLGSLPHAASVYRPVPPRVSPEFGRDLFGVLLEVIVALPGVVEGDKEKGHRWLQGLADLAFEDEAYVKALQLYLQAGAIRSANYCDRASSMPRDIFTPWVIRRMVAACRAIGAGVQAAVLCQCLPVPDHESAFRILQEVSLVADRDAAAYFECIWEVPILELLVSMHAKSGDEERVSALIALLQQPALNVHNPPSIRHAHVASLEQCFLQRLSGELL